MRVLMLLPAVLLLAAPLAAQSFDADGSAWTVYLQGEVRNEVQSAVEAIEQWWRVRDDRYRETYAEIERLYVTARDEELTWEEYAESLAALEPALVAADDSPRPGGEPSERDRGALPFGMTSAEVDARLRIARAFPMELPAPGTQAFSDAETWLATLARSEGFPLDRFLEATGMIEEALLSSLSSSDARRFVSDLRISQELPDDLSAFDRIRRSLELWRLRVLAALDDERVDLLDSMLVATSGSSASVGADVRSRLAEIMDERSRLIELRSLLPLPARTVALLSAGPLGDAAAFAEGRVAEYAGLSSVLLHLADSRREAPRDAYGESATLAFLADTAESLLGVLSELQRYELARAMGLTLREIDELRVGLHRLRLAVGEAVRSGEPGAARTRSDRDRGDGEAAAIDDSLFADYLAEGAEFVEAARPWADGERSRSGDEYRWAMLAIVSHPYAQYLVASLPEPAETRAMVEAFVAQTYEEALRRPGIAALDLEPVVLGDAIQPVQRVYRTESDAVANELYDAFAAAGQGVAELSRDFGASYAAGLTVAGYWSHMHGLHVAVERDGGAAARIRSRVDAWLALARAARLVDEEVSLTLRGLLSLRRTVRDELDPIAVASGIASVAAYAPRLPTARSLLDEVSTFTSDPRATLSALAQLYEVDEGDATIDAIAADVERTAERLRRVELADRRLVEELATRPEGSQ
ncbi:MAG: hypothetical protein ACLFUA_09500 [Spirochaetales bacterium]